MNEENNSGDWPIPNRLLPWDLFQHLVVRIGKEKLAKQTIARASNGSPHHEVTLELVSLRKMSVIEWILFPAMVGEMPESQMPATNQLAEVRNRAIAAEKRPRDRGAAFSSVEVRVRDRHDLAWQTRPVDRTH